MLTLGKPSLQWCFIKEIKKSRKQQKSRAVSELAHGILKKKRLVSRLLTKNYAGNNIIMVSVKKQNKQITRWI